MAMSMCGMSEQGAPPSDEEFDRHLVNYPDVSIVQMAQCYDLCMCLSSKHFTAPPRTASRLVNKSLPMQRPHLYLCAGVQKPQHFFIA